MQDPAETCLFLLPGAHCLLESSITVFSLKHMCEGRFVEGHFQLPVSFCEEVNVRSLEGGIKNKIERS